MTDPSAGLIPRPPATGLRRVLYVCLGLFFVGLAILGVILPVLPTTPFLLLASFFFVRSSRGLNAWLLRSRVFGPFLRDWQQHRGVRPRVKVTALSMIPLAVFSSAYFGNLAWPLVVLLIVLGLIGMVVVIRLPLVRDEVAVGTPGKSAPRQEEPSRKPRPLASEPLQGQEA